ncbi:MAG: alpha-glucan family phosphorylase [Nanoarchaeota archaeon]
MSKKAKVAYFCMEFGIEDMVYGGGLGILAGDFIKSCADLALPVVGVGLLYNDGNFHQELSEDGVQTERYERFYPEKFMRKVTNDVSVQIEGREVKVGVWQFNVKGEKSTVPILYLDTNGQNSGRPWDEKICSKLYPAEQYERLTQEHVLGTGGVQALEVLGYDKLEKYHMNEGHAALLGLELISKYGFDEARKKIVFTTHTCVPAGIDEFSRSLGEQVLRENFPSEKELYDLTGSNNLNMMRLAMALSSQSFGVSKIHEQVSKHLFKDFPRIKELYSINNGVHLPTWTAPEVQKLYDEATNKNWRQNPESLENVLQLSDNAVLDAHSVQKRNLGEFLRNDKRVKGSAEFSEDKLTIGFARRFTAYKQATLVFEQIDRLRKLGKDVQIVFSGKAHPRDNGGKEIIKEVFNYMKELENEVSIWFVEDYTVEVAKYLTRGVDLWLNNPQRCLEASGTSGMKAAANFIPQLSIIDGWWTPDSLGGLIEGVTGWSIGRHPTEADIFALSKSQDFKDHLHAIDARNDAEDFYNKLENVIIPRFKDKTEWVKVMKGSAANNAPKFNSHRMAKEYFEKAYKIQNTCGP